MLKYFWIVATSILGFFLSAVVEGEPRYRLDWLQRIDSLNSGQEEAWHIHQLNNAAKNFVITGMSTSSSAGDYGKRIFFMKLDSLGNFVDKDYYDLNDDDSCHNYQGFELHSVDDGDSLIFVGHTNAAGYNQIVLLKMDNNFNIGWDRKIGDSTKQTGAFSVQQIEPYEGFVIAGYQWEDDYRDAHFCLINTNDTGGVEWLKLFGDSLSFPAGTTIGRSVRVLYSGNDATGIIATGYAKHNDTINDRYDYDVYVVKTDLDGDVVFEETYGGALGQFGENIRVVGSDYYVGGAGGFWTLADEPANKAYMIKLDSDGDSLWAVVHGIPTGNEEGSFQSMITTDSGLIGVGTAAVGITEGWIDIYIAEFNQSDGSNNWEKILADDDDPSTVPASQRFDKGDFCYWIQPTIGDDGFVITGFTFSMGANTGGNTDTSDVFVMKFVPGDCQCGDVDCDQSIDIDDLLYLSDYVESSGPAPPDTLAANVDYFYGITSDDVDYLVDYMFYSGPAPNCRWILGD